jgi:hypothetical protein
MSVNFRQRSRLILAKIQAAEDTEETPTPAADAARVINPRFTPDLLSLSTAEEVTNSLSIAAPIFGGGRSGMTFGAFVRGAGTAGTAPEYGPLLRACGFSETLMTPAVTGTAQAGDADTITLAAAEPATDDIYKAMPIRLTGGTGSGQRNLIKAYDGATKIATVVVPWTTEPDATSLYSIDENAVYRPITVAPEFITIWSYLHHNDPGEDSIRSRLADGAGTFSVALRPQQLGRFDFTFRGELPDSPDSVARPADPVYPSVEPESFIGGDAALGGLPVKFSDFSCDLGLTVEQHEDAAAALGFDSAQPTLRQPTGRIVPPVLPLASSDPFADWRNSVSRDLWLNWGSAAGKRVSFFFPAIRYTGHEESDNRGFAARTLPFQATGLDDELWITVH